MLGIAALPTPEFREALLETYAVSDRMNQPILEPAPGGQNRRVATRAPSRRFSPICTTSVGSG